LISTYDESMRGTFLFSMAIEVVRGGLLTIFRSSWASIIRCMSLLLTREGWRDMNIYGGSSTEDSRWSASTPFNLLLWFFFHGGIPKQ
jgi:hypothetical protein